jgi:hypothetical protein
MMKKAIGVVLFFSTLCAPALAGGQNGGGSSAPRSWSPAPSGHVFTAPAPVRIEPVRTPVVNNGPPAKSVAPAAPAVKVKFPQINREWAMLNNEVDHGYNPLCYRDAFHNPLPRPEFACNVNPYFTPMFFEDTNL